MSYKISKMFVITATHCFDKTSELVVRAGATTSTWYGYIYKWALLYIHPSYVPETVTDNAKNDIAILKMADEIYFNDKVKPIRMAEESFPRYNHLIVTMSGYGRVCWDCKESGKLIQILQSTMDLDECRKRSSHHSIIYFTF